MKIKDKCKKINSLNFYNKIRSDKLSELKKLREKKKNNLNKNLNMPLTLKSNISNNATPNQINKNNISYFNNPNDIDKKSEISNIFRNDNFNNESNNNLKQNMLEDNNYSGRIIIDNKSDKISNVQTIKSENIEENNNEILINTNNHLQNKEELNNIVNTPSNPFDDESS